MQTTKTSSRRRPRVPTVEEAPLPPPTPPTPDGENMLNWDPNLAKVVADDLSFICRRIPLNKATATSEQLLDFIHRSVFVTNMHSHKQTCKKGMVGRKGDHSDCRMGYDRLLVKVSHLMEKDGSLLLLLRRSHGMLVPFIAGLMLACPSNHSINLTADASRWRRDYQLWSDAVKAGNTTVSLCPNSMSAPI